MFKKTALFLQGGIPKGSSVMRIILVIMAMITSGKKLVMVMVMTGLGWWQNNDDRMIMTMMMARWGYMSAVYHNTDTCWLRRTFSLAARPKINLCDDDVRTWERQKYLELILFDLYLRKTASWKILTWTGPISPGVVLVQSSEEIIVQGALGPDWMELPRNVYSPLLPYHSYMDFWYKEYPQTFIKNRNLCSLALCHIIVGPIWTISSKLNPPAKYWCALHQSSY